MVCSTKKTFVIWRGEYERTMKNRMCTRLTYPTRTTCTVFRLIVVQIHRRKPIHCSRVSWRCWHTGDGNLNVASLLRLILLKQRLIPSVITPLWHHNFKILIYYMHCTRYTSPVVTVMPGANSNWYMNAYIHIYEQRVAPAEERHNLEIPTWKAKWKAVLRVLVTIPPNFRDTVRDILDSGHVKCRTHLYETADWLRTYREYQLSDNYFGMTKWKTLHIKEHWPSP